jgi:MFS transporter, PAT family, beta-lactamase induction signal transducer AmpG
MRYLNFRIFLMFILGFSSGLPLSLVGSTLVSWYASFDVSMMDIGLLALVSQPYIFKFLWAPFLDYFSLNKIFSKKINKKINKRIDNRRSWIIFSQILLILGLILMAFQSPNNKPVLLACFALFVAFSSATQDIVIDAYKIEILPEKQRGLGSAVQVEAYRLAMLFAGGLGLIIADHMGWRFMYLLMAACLLVPLFIIYFSPDFISSNNRDDNRDNNRDLNIKQNLKLRVKYWHIFYKPIKDLKNNHGKSLYLFLFFIILYKLGDAFAGVFTYAFLLKHLHFSLSQVGMINKIVGLIASLLGIFFGGVLLLKMRLFKALLIFGILQMLTNILLLSLCYGSPSVGQVSLTIFCENCAGGMGTSAFIVLLMRLCNPKFAAGQYALLSALSAVGRVYLQPFAGWVIDAYGWDVFYFCSVLLCFPGLGLLIYMRRFSVFGVLSLNKA